MSKNFPDETDWLTSELSRATSLWTQSNNAFKKGKSKRYGQLIKETLKVSERLKTWLDEEPATDLKSRFAETINGMLLTNLDSLGTLCRAEDRAEEAKEIFLRALKICEESFGKEHKHYLSLLDGLADTHFDLGEDAECEQLWRQAIALRERIYGRNHHSVADSLLCLAQVCDEQGKEEEAIAAGEEALAIQKALYGVEHDEYKIMKSSLQMDELLRQGMSIEDALTQVLPRD